jgi:aspartate/methionine/tyrosine aminotransferase
MRVPERIRSISPPPIEVISSHAEKLRREGAQVISLGQAVPGFPPTDGAIEMARQALEEPSTHIYSADPGIFPLRKALSTTLAEHNRMEVDPENEIIITAGANQAFVLASLTLLEPGDKVLLPSPYYFNHEMAIRMVGAVPVKVPLSENTGFRLRMGDLKPYLETDPRALVIVSPNNPTGSVYDPAELRRIGRTLAPREITIISDETYQHFVYEDAEHFSLASVPEISSQVITIGSFSKSFSLTGWRVGYLVSERNFIREALKAQDSMLVCAPVISQKAALGSLQEPVEVITWRREILNQRRQFLIERLDGIPQLTWRPTNGAYFAFVRVEGCTDSARLAMDILDSVHLVTIPGSVFGQHGEGYLRLSYGSLELPDLEEACKRLSRYFAAA